MLNCEKALLAMNDVPDAYIESARAMLGYRVGEQKRFSVRKRIIAFALAAALVLSLGIAAYAVYVHWSRGMERKLPATGTEKQRAVRYLPDCQRDSQRCDHIGGADSH